MLRPHFLVAHPFLAAGLPFEATPLAPATMPQVDQSVVGCFRVHLMVKLWFWSVLVSMDYIYIYKYHKYVYIYNLYIDNKDENGKADLFWMIFAQMCYGHIRWFFDSSILGVIPQFWWGQIPWFCINGKAKHDFEDYQTMGYTMVNDMIYIYRMSRWPKINTCYITRLLGRYVFNLMSICQAL